MNWALLAILTLVLVVMLSVYFAVIAYIRHWAKRREARAATASLTEGLFFKRYVPPSLYEKYDIQPKASPNWRKGFIRRSLLASATLAILGTVAFSLYQHMDMYRPRIDLSIEDITQLNLTTEQLVRNANVHHPRLSDVMALISDKRIVLVEPEGPANTTAKLMRQTALSQWQRYLREQGIDFTSCSLTKDTPCVAQPSASIVLIPPSRWQLDELQSLLDQGASVLLYGPPAQLYEGDSSVSWHGLTLQRKDRRTSYLALVADQKLTLGFDAGLVIPAVTAFDGYQAISDHPQALAVHGNRQITNSRETRLYAPDLDKGRLVWMDFSPNASDHTSDVQPSQLNALVASILRYLSGEVYSDIATWPDGQRFAALFSMEVQSRPENAARFIDRLESAPFPVNWEVLSNLAQDHRRLIRRMSKTGHLTCGGDFSDKFPRYPLEVQTSRIARCKKVLETISGLDVDGFSPPGASYDEFTVNAMINTGMRYYAASTSDRGVPVLETTAESKRSIVSIPQTKGNANPLWARSHFGENETLAIIENEIAEARMLGSLYSITIRDQYAYDEAHLNVILHTGQTLLTEDCYFADIAKLSEWWRYRQALRRHETIDPKLNVLYRPVQLVVDKEGKLQRKEFDANTLLATASSHTTQ